MTLYIARGTVTGVGRSIGRELVERDGELAQLRNATTGTPAGHGGVVIIEGPAGIGKTRLLEAARALAEEKRLGVAWARGSELEREYGFGLLRQLLEPFAMSSDGLLREELFKGAAALAAALFQPGADPEARAPEPDFSTLHGLYWLLAELADEQPLAVCIDDVQWADPPSLRFLSFASRRIESVAITIFATLRTGEVGSDPELVSQLTTESGVLTMRPRPLTGSGVEAIVREELAFEPSRDLVEACLESTGGNPFYLKALLGEVAGSGGDVGVGSVRRVTEIGSGEVSALLLRRLDALHEGAKELAGAVAVLGDGTHLPRAARLAGLEPMQAAEVLQTLVSARLLREQGGIGFSHPIVRSSVYASLPPAAAPIFTRRRPSSCRQKALESRRLPVIFFIPTPEPRPMPPRSFGPPRSGRWPWVRRRAHAASSNVRCSSRSRVTSRPRSCSSSGVPRCAPAYRGRLTIWGR